MTIDASCVIKTSKQMIMCFNANTSSKNNGARTYSGTYTTSLVAFLIPNYSLSFALVLPPFSLTAPLTSWTAFQRMG
jgi:hypothetical protein